MTEHQIQSNYFSWVEAELYPNGVPVEALKGLELAHAIPNGGDRHVLVGVKLKKEGARKGVPDVYIPVSRGGFAGLSIEFKAPDGNPTKEQRDRIERMQREGWCAVLCWSSEAAKRVTIGYLGLTQISYK